MDKKSDKNFIPKKFFVTQGEATSSVSSLNAFDAALRKAGIAECNLVQVSSALPGDIERIDNAEIEPGAVTFCVLARMDGKNGETIGAGIGWAWGTTKDGKRYGIVAEAHGHKAKEDLEKELKGKLEEMAKIRELKIEKIHMEVKSMTITGGKYGSVVVALVYLF